jgi:hypothetical protein
MSFVQLNPISIGRAAFFRRVAEHVCAASGSMPLLLEALLLAVPARAGPSLSTGSRALIAANQAGTQMSIRRFRLVELSLCLAHLLASENGSGRTYRQMPYGSAGRHGIQGSARPRTTRRLDCSFRGRVAAWKHRPGCTAVSCSACPAGMRAASLFPGDS